MLALQRNTLYNGTHFRPCSPVSRSLGRTVAHFAIQRAQREARRERRRGLHSFRVNAALPTACTDDRPAARLPVCPFACQPATTHSGSNPSTHPVVRPRPRRRWRCRCRLFVTIGQKFHSNRYATHRHHRPSSTWNPNVCQPSQLPPNHPATHHTICLPTSQPVSHPATLSASAQRQPNTAKNRLLQ